MFHRTYYPLLEPVPGAQLVTTVHDLIDERFGASARAKLRSRLKRTAALRARRLVAVSEATKRDMVERWNVDDARIRVIHHGVRRPVDDGRTKSRVAGPFLLFVGRRDSHKNFAGLLRTLGRLRTRSLDMILVAAGGGPFQGHERKLIKLCRMEDRVIQLAVTDSELAALYRHARALVCPSFYEGFGMPVLEAMSSGCCVCCSNVASLPEVAGDAAAYFDPADTDTIAAALETVLTDDERRRALVAAGRVRAGRYTWRASAEKHLALYRELAEEQGAVT